jgi:Bacterial antitoxin of type II TA system, VapB
VKTTLDIQDELFARAKRLAKRTGRPLRALVEEGLRHVLAQAPAVPYELPDRSVGDASRPDPLEAMTWNELRDEIYGRGDVK